MGSPICPSSWSRANFGSSVCDLLKNLLLTNDKLKSFFDWMFNSPTEISTTCTISERFGAELVEMMTPIGSGFWTPVDLHLDEEVWVKADGRILNREGTYKKLFNIFGTQFNQLPGTTDPVGADKFRVPDLSGRFMLVTGQRKTTTTEETHTADDGTVTHETVSHIHPNYPPVGSIQTADADKATGGEDEVTLTEGQVSVTPFSKHQHGVWAVAGEQPDLKPPRNEQDNAGIVLVKSGVKVPPYRGWSEDRGDALNDIPDSGDHWHDNWTLAHYLTSAPTVPPTGATVAQHTNMTPYMTGFYYIRANYKVNGVLVP